jgi:hypothetical protein
VKVGDRVRIERDETRHPSKGTWPQFRGRTGTVVEVNTDRGRPHLTEYGVVFIKATPRTDGRGGFNHSDVVTWFKAYEMQRVASERPAGARLPVLRTDDTRQGIIPIRKGWYDRSDTKGPKVVVNGQLKLPVGGRENCS